MITFQRSTDVELIKRVMTHPQIYPSISDDACPPAEQFQPTMHETIHYMVVKDGEELLGLWVLSQQNSVCWEVHTCLLPCAWGDRAVLAAKTGLDWLWKNTSCQRLVTNVPEYNLLAYRFSKAAGFQLFGRNSRSFLKHGKLFDQLMLGVSRPEGY